MLRRRLATALSAVLLALPACGGDEGTARTQPPAATAATPAPAATDAPESAAAAATPKPPQVLAPTDPNVSVAADELPDVKVTVPDGSPEQLLDLMDEALTVQPEDDSAAASYVAFRTAYEKILLAADKVMAHKAATPAQRQEAAVFKVSMLHQGVESNMDGSAEALAGFARRLQADQPGSDAARMAAFFDIHARHENEFGLGMDALADVERFIAEHRGAEEGAILLQEMGQAAEFADDVESAVKVYGKVVAEFPDSEVARQVAGVLTRLQLPGKPMRLAGATLDGGTVDLADYRGKVVLVSFWATWCEACQEELPLIARLRKSYSPDDFVVVGVPLDVDAEAVKAYLADAGLDWPQVYPAEGIDADGHHPVAAQYGVYATPTNFLVDRSGKVVYTTVRGPELAPAVAGLVEPQVTADADAPAAK